MSALPPLPERPVEPPNTGWCGAPPGTVSPRLSFKGWLFGVWLSKNKSFVKAVLAPCSAIVTGGALSDTAALRVALGVLGLGLLTIAFRLAWDAFDFFVSEVTPDEPKAGD